MEKNGKPTMKCLREHDWSEASSVVYIQPDGSISKDYTGVEEEHSALYRECRKCGEPQVRDWRMVSRYSHKPNPPRIDKYDYIKKLKERFE